MTEVQFHHGTADPLRHACRLLAKAYESGARVAVTATPDRLAELDVLLWTFDDLAFVPHARLAAGRAPAQRLLRTPIWLVDRAVDAPQARVLVNLGPEIAPGFESFERLFEVVGRDEAARLSGRGRWRHLQSRGYAIAQHEVA
ncbi:MAG TPA: DNA polymerase III subunit chi [Methylibium sp.]|uniref:DNA polymerase III subunit chi n=1 Tax=Methylibium sp. TaxID=2067992 RepID=UPI002DB8E4AE|nr:DNA polymerase III subunit chi [Methylibium sp.]HEU4460161.1 DNA polymerase III subunit chi [Methylibium sp.]